MSPCEECSEFYSEENYLCPICKLKLMLSAFQRELSKSVLVIDEQLMDYSIELGEKVAENKNQEYSKEKLKNIEEGLEIIRKLLPHVRSFLELEIPDKAIPVGYNEYEDVRPITLSILRIEWEEVRYSIQDVCGMLLYRFHELGKNSEFSELFKLGFKQIGREYQSEYMFSVQSYYRLPIYMESIGFEKIQEIDLMNVDLEIIGGYYSSLRKIREISPPYVCLHQVPTDINFDANWRFHRGKIQFALSKYKSDLEIAHFIGPESDLLDFFKKFLCDDKWPALYGGSMRTDVEDAVVIWWIDKSKLSFKPIKPGTIT